MINPCPCCGGWANIHAIDGINHDWYYVVCGNIMCEMSSGMFETKDEAIAAWNRRVK